MASTTASIRRRWYQFRLGSILLLMAGVAVVLAPKVNQVRRQRQAAELVKQLGGTVEYNYRDSKKLPARLRSWLGDDFFAPIFRVDLSHTKIDHSQLDNLRGWLPHLWALSLSHTACDDKSLTLVGELRELEHLELAGTSVTDKGLQSIERLESLLFLDLHDTRVSDGAIPLLNRLPSLTTVNLQGTHVSDGGVKQCRAFATLEGPARVVNRYLVALTELTELEFDDQPLGNVIEYLAQRHDCEIKLDARDVDTLDTWEKSLVTDHSKRVPLIAALKRILQPLGLTFTIRHQVLFVGKGTLRPRFRLPLGDDLSPGMRAALEKPCQINVSGMLLSETLAYLEQLQGVRFRIDESVASPDDNEGWGYGPPVRLPFEAVSFQSILELILDQLELTCTIEDDTIVIRKPTPGHSS